MKGTGVLADGVMGFGVLGVRVPSREGGGGRSGAGMVDMVPTLPLGTGLVYIDWR